jgi:hypothetical protein
MLWHWRPSADGRETPDSLGGTLPDAALGESAGADGCAQALRRQQVCFGPL